MQVQTQNVIQKLNTLDEVGILMMEAYLTGYKSGAKIKEANEATEKDSATQAAG